MARAMVSISLDINRQVGVLINRRGKVQWVIVGDSNQLWLPDIGRARGGQVRLRGIRLVHTHLKNEPLCHDDLADLALLHLDLVAAIGTQSKSGKGSLGPIYYSHLMPDQQKGLVSNLVGPLNFYDYQLHFLNFIKGLEEEIARKGGVPQEVALQERAILVNLYSKNRHTAKQDMAELEELARSADVKVVTTILQHRLHRDSRYLVGKGKLEELSLKSLQLGASLVIFNQELSPIQSREISANLDTKVIDRTQLILDIFAQHAKSKDGKIQVELAQLKYNLPLLSQKNTGLSRLTGEIGGRGPGETKLEINRRRARQRIAILENKIAQLSKKRGIMRSQRFKNKLPVIAIVGYTNAGKSTLLNTLTNSQVGVKDKMFATLDPTSRRLRFPKHGEVIITDTVGFISALPTDLINAFKATLEELEYADLLLHVVDRSDPVFEKKITTVENLLQQLNLAHIPILRLFNKVDLLPNLQYGDDSNQFAAIPISARKRKGLERLVERVIPYIEWPDGKEVIKGFRINR